MTDSTTRLPPEVDAIVNRTMTALRDAAGNNLAALVVYGSAARGEYQPERSDVNLLVCAGQLALEHLIAIGGTLQRAWRQDRVRPYLVVTGEVPHLADVFPLKLLEIKAAHVLLFGQDPLTTVDIDIEHLRIRVEQELRNHLIRLRWNLIHSGGQPDALTRLLAASGRQLRTELFGLLHVIGKGPAGPGQDAVFQSASERLKLDENCLDSLRGLTCGKAPADLRALADQTLVLLQLAIETADRAGKAVG